MNETWENDFLESLKKLFSESGMEIEIVDYNGQKALEIVHNGANDGDDTTILVEHIFNDTTQIRIIESVFSEIDDDCAQKLQAVISWLNQNLCMGCFVLSDEGDYLYYNYSFEITEDMDAPIIMDILGQTLGIIGETIREGIEILTPLMNGEKSIDEMLNSNIAILQ